MTRSGICALTDYVNRHSDFGEISLRFPINARVRIKRFNECREAGITVVLVSEHVSTGASSGQ